MERKKSFSDFLASPPGGPFGLVVLLVFSVFGSKVSDLIPGDQWWQTAVTVVSILILLWIAYLAWRSRGLKMVLVPQNQRPEKHKGLIVLVSRGRPEDLENRIPTNLAEKGAINYHCGTDANALKVCWLIATSGEEGSQLFAQELENYCVERNIKPVLHVIGDGFDVQETHDVIEKIYKDEAQQNNLTEADIIADFTGGVRTMSAGMVLACRDRRSMEYMYGRKAGVSSMPRLIKFVPKSSR